MDTAAPPLAASAGAFITDERGDVLMVKPEYTEYWNLPGGHVDGEESPSVACAREVRRELGLDIEVRDLLVVAWLDSGGQMPRVHYVFDGGEVSARQRRSIHLEENDAGSYCFAAPERVEAPLIPPFAQPLWAAALTARRTKRMVCLEVEV
ncbi:NUDIX domain-containing protein [Streptomyces sp. G45]|uniref:NUDIX domain-containing protein n=1 Tax=Streptomyces sp. G45 TaxID=3406627 RepID=UPI003C199E3B